MKQGTITKKYVHHRISAAHYSIFLDLSIFLLLFNQYRKTAGSWGRIEMATSAPM